MPDAATSIDLVAALLLWPELDERCFRLVARCLSDDAPPDWESVRSALERDGWIEATQVPGTFRVTAGQRPTLEASVARLGGTRAIEQTLAAGRARLQDPVLLEDLARWAQASGAWQVLELFWMTLSEASVEFSPATLEVLRDVPVSARREHPLLTWASGAAASILAASPQERQNALIDRLLFDSALIHGDWSLNEDTGTAVLAGTFRLIGQRRLPATGSLRGLDAAWTTKEELDAFIERRTGEGRGPSRLSHSVFRAFSARLAVLRADFPAALQEARMALVLADWEPVAVLARGVDALARAIAFDAPPPSSDADLPSAPPSEISIRGLSGMGSAFQLLASGYHALNRLNREEVDLVLSLVTAEAADVAGLWSLWTGLSALRGAVWGNPSESLNRLLAEISNRPAMVNELDEPLGRMVLGRARVLLLAKTGAIAAAKAAIEEMPPGLRPVPMARTALWAGQANEALRHAEAGLLQTGVRPADRPRLAVIAAAASLLAGTATEEAQERAIRALDDLFATRGLWPLAALPASARHPLLELYGAQHSVDEATFSELTGLLADLNDAESVSRAVRLTHRERQLLPLLATDDSIPEIAKTLQVSVHTVRTQVATLREKFHAATRAELIRQASLLGAIPPQPPDTRGR